MSNANALKSKTYGVLRDDEENRSCRCYRQHALFCQHGARRSVGSAHRACGAYSGAWAIGGPLTISRRPSTRPAALATSDTASLRQIRPGCQDRARLPWHLRHLRAVELVVGDDLRAVLTHPEEVPMRRRAGTQSRALSPSTLEGVGGSSSWLLMNMHCFS